MRLLFSLRQSNTAADLRRSRPALAPPAHSLSPLPLPLLPLLLLALLPHRAAPQSTTTTSSGGGSCLALNGCSGNGVCDASSSRCLCYAGYGADSDIAAYKAPDCSLRTCPADRAWADVARGAAAAHLPAECSGAGLCDRGSGRCRCFAGFEGEACQRSSCPGTPACSGHGRCDTIAQLASEANAEPLGPPAVYGGDPGGATWDEDKVQGCACDSAWAVGYGAGQRQLPQWTGPDCSQQRCPSGDDPRTPHTDEQDCAFFDDNGRTWRGDVGSDGRNYRPGAALPPGVTVAQAATCVPGVSCGAPGNLCYVSCSRRGNCDLATGTCACFQGYYGPNCGLKSVQG